MLKNEETKEATINIFGDITSWPWEELGDTSSYNLSKQLEELNNYDVINIHINSYGGEVKEGLAIYNSLVNHKAKVKTYCDGFACSIASVIFMAGGERIMNKASLLMIHNAWLYASGNAEELRKVADDLDKITQASVNAYLEKINITEEELKTLMDNETWLGYEEAIEKGFATDVVSDTEEKASQNVKESLIQMILANQENKEETTDDEQDEEDDVEKDIDIKNESNSDDEDLTDEEDTSTDENEETTDEEDKTSDEADTSNEDDIEKNKEDEESTQKAVDFLCAMIKGGMIE